MNAITNSTFKSTMISIGLHACVVLLGSMVIYKSPLKLELSGEGGRGPISLSSINFTSGRKASPSKISFAAVESSRVQTVSTRAAAVSSAVIGGSVSTGESNGSNAVGTAATGSGNGEGSGHGNGQDFDQGKLFSQIKIFFENRLGSTLNINVEQLIKIKLTLGQDGEILDADLIQGKLDFQSLKKVLNVARNIPLKNYWKSTAPYPQEMVIPLILSPS